MVARDPVIGGEVRNDLLDFIATGKIRPHVSKRYSLEDAPLAYRELIDRKALGKVVIEP